MAVNTPLCVRFSPARATVGCVSRLRTSRFGDIFDLENPNTQGKSFCWKYAHVNDAFISYGYPAANIEFNVENLSPAQVIYCADGLIGELSQSLIAYNIPKSIARKRYADGKKLVVQFVFCHSNNVSLQNFAQAINRMMSVRDGYDILVTAPDTDHLNGTLNKQKTSFAYSKLPHNDGDDFQFSVLTVYGAHPPLQNRMDTPAKITDGSLFEPLLFTAGKEWPDNMDSLPVSIVPENKCPAIAVYCKFSSPIITNNQRILGIVSYLSGQIGALHYTTDIAYVDTCLPGNILCVYLIAYQKNEGAIRALFRTANNFCEKSVAAMMPASYAQQFSEKLLQTYNSETDPAEINTIQQSIESSMTTTAYISSSLLMPLFPDVIAIPVMAVYGVVDSSDVKNTQPMVPFYISGVWLSTLTFKPKDVLAIELWDDNVEKTVPAIELWDDNVEKTVPAAPTGKYPAISIAFGILNDSEYQNLLEKIMWLGINKAIVCKTHCYNFDNYPVVILRLYTGQANAPALFQAAKTVMTADYSQ